MKKKPFVEYSDIETATKDVHSKALQTIGPWCTGHFPKMINVLLKLNYFIENKEGKDINTDPAACFLEIAREKYLEAPYLMYACNDLMLHGHYLNALIQTRALFDYFVTCKYLHVVLEHAIPYAKREKVVICSNSNSKSKRKYLSMQEMYEKILPPKHAFGEYWGNTLSGIAHGKPGTGYFRIDPATHEMIVVPKFDLEQSFLIINALLPLTYGYIINQKKFFVGHLKELPEELLEEIDAILESVKKHQENLLKKYPKMAGWLKDINHLCDIP